MSRLGQLSLQRVIIDYSAYSTADGLRHAFAREIPQFKKDFPSVVVEVRPRSKASVVTGVYRDGSEISFPVALLSSQAIFVRLQEMAQTCNDKSVALNNHYRHYQNRSVQGSWNPYLWMAERHEERIPEPKWDRKLSDREWDYYVDKYSSKLKNDRAALKKALERATELPDQQTKEIAERWQKYITPTLQTDMEDNLSQIKKEAAKGKFPENVSIDEFRLFSTPDIAGSGAEDIIRGLRHKEMRKTEKWWEQRQAQLKPPA
jgi:hypothetical protein